MSRTRVALIGTGFIADIHAESYRGFVPDAEVVAVCSRSADRARAASHGISRWFVEPEEAIARSECEVVDICVPNHLHAAIALAAAAAGKLGDPGSFMPTCPLRPMPSSTRSNRTNPIEAFRHDG